MNTKENINKLKNLIIYQMSLGSKELFHSNLWEWLINKDSLFAKVFFKDIKGEVIEARREENHRDLIIHCKEVDGTSSEYIIENKIKALPSNEQLERYVKKDKNKVNCKGHLLTCVAEPSFDVKSLGWDCLFYKDIGKRLRVALNNDNQKFSPFEKETIEKYCSIIEIMGDVFEGLLDDSKGRLNYDCGNLEEIKLADVYKKLKADDFLRYFNENYKNKVVTPNGYEFKPDSGFTRKDAILDLRFDHFEDGQRTIGIGVQIQGNRYKIVAERRKIDGQSTDKIFNEFLNYGWFDGTYNRNNRAVFGHETTMFPHAGKRYDKYEKDYSFVYQYYDLNSNHNFYDIICEMVVKDLAKAKEIIEKYNI